MIPQTPADVVEQSYRERLKSLAPVLSFSCARNGDFNAWVSTGGADAPMWSIEVCDGLIHSCHLVCMAAMSSPNCLRSIGNPDAEIGWAGRMSEPLPWLDAASSYLQIHEELGDVRVRPSCPERAEFSDRLLTCMLDFVIYHEISHVASRHLGPHQKLAERYSSESCPDSNRSAQHVKEMQADAGGAITSALRCSNADKYEQRMRSWGLGVCLIAYLLGSSEDPDSFEDPDTLTGRSHPHPSVRLIHVGSVATSHPALGISEGDFKGYVSDMIDVVTELNLYSSAVKYLTIRRDEASSEYERMLAHFEDACEPGIDPPKELLDVMSDVRNGD